MTTLNERSVPRLRELMAELARRNGPTVKEELFRHVAQMFPPAGDELVIQKNRLPRWETDLLWKSTNMAKAGWLVKDGRGSWSITPAGRDALGRIPDPDAFHVEGARLFSEWNEQRKAPQRRAWLVRGSSVLGINMVPEWLTDGFCSLAASQLREIGEEATAEEIEEAARADYDHLKHQELKAKVDEILAFTTKTRPGDVVITTSDGQVYLGNVTSGWRWTDSDGGRSNLRRGVEWLNAEVPIPFASLPAPLPARLASGSTVVDLTADLAAIEGLTALEADPPAEVGAGTGEDIAQPRHEHLRQPSAALADELFVGSDWLAEVADLLDERRQVIFYGPPGTGKTFIARRLAADLVGPEQVKLVQFHPAYTYEDFFEGYRPAPGSRDGTIGFELRAGPLRQLVNRAREHPDQAFVLIVDEINRANLAKVFGELYFLLEYRDQAIDLLYSSDDETGFTLPTNLYLIGTMNTADRSIALVDSAMRRRFAFVALDPATEPTRSLLARWSAHHGLGPLAAELLAELNRRIDDPEFLIGPSYFMTRPDPDAFAPERLGRIWRRAILPLLQEHFYGSWDSHARRFDLASMLRVIPSAAPVTDPVDGGSAPPPVGPGPLRGGWDRWRAMNALHLLEGAPPQVLDLADKTAQGLAAAKILSVYPLGPGRWEVTDAGRVGVARLDDVTVWIRPKLPIARLLWLLGFAHHPGWRPSEAVGYSRSDELVPALAEAFAIQTSRALQLGLLHGYEQVDDTTPVLKGRLRINDQLRERYGVAVPLLVRYDDHTPDIAENQIVRTATERLLHLPGVTPGTMSRLRRLRHTLTDVTLVPAGRSLPVWHPNRLNARYHDALWLAEIICAGEAVAHVAGDVRLTGFLVNMAKVYEDFVTATLTEALTASGGSCRAQDPWYLDEDSNARMRPDLVWYLDGHPAAVIDAKYKAEKPAGFPDADLYQLLAYATALGLSEGHLVYAKGNEQPKRWRVRNTAITVVAHTLDLEAPPEAVLGQVTDLAAKISNSRERGWKGLRARLLIGAR